MPKQLTRQDLRDQLAAWASGRLAAVDVYNWANDWFATEGSTVEDAVANEVLWCLESLDMSLLTAADIPTLLAALAPGVTTALEARALVNRRLAEVGLEARRQELRGDPFYYPFNGL